MSWLSCTLQLSTKLSVEKACDQPVKRRIWAFGRSEVTQNSYSPAPVRTHGQIFGIFTFKLTFSAEIYSWTGVWKEGGTGSSSRLALIRPSVFQQNRTDGKIGSRYGDRTVIFVPQKLPSGWNVYVTQEWNRIFSVHQGVIRKLEQLNSWFRIWGVMLESIYIHMTKKSMVSGSKTLWGSISHQ